MRIVTNLILASGFALVSALSAYAQEQVVVTGVRFSYPLVEKWIQQYKAENPSAQIAIETRTVTDPEKYDLLIEAYDEERLKKEGREFVSIGRYALLPVANAKSAFAREFTDKGFIEKTYKQVFFHDIYAEKDHTLTTPFTVYTRLQKAGAPITFAKYFGYEQQQINGKTIAGADEHLITALLKDETGITYTVPGLAYNLSTRKVTDGLAIIPVDLDGNGRVSKDEKAVDDLDRIIEKLESEKVRNVPIENLHISIGKNSQNAEAKKFLLWIASNGVKDLKQYGYLQPDLRRLEHERANLEKILALR